MSELVWTCHGGSQFVAVMQGLHLVVRPAEMKGEYRYQLFGSSGSTGTNSCLSSGQHAQLREAMAIAEARAKLFSAQLASAKLDRPAPADPQNVTSAAKRINLNTATRPEIERLPMVDAETAQALIAARPFRSWDDLARVPGFYLAMIDDLRQGGAELN